MTTVAIVAFDGCAGFSLGAMTGTMLLANRINQKSGRTHPMFEWKVVSRLGGLVSTGARLRIASDAKIGKEQFDLVCIPVVDYMGVGDFEKVLKDNRALYRWLAYQWGSGATIAAFGTGTFMLAESGLLDGREATTVQWMMSRFRERYPRVRVEQNVLLTESDRLLCGAERTSHSQLLMRLANLFMGYEVASRCARSVKRDVGRSGGWVHMPLFGNPSFRSPLVARINDWLVRNMSAGPNLEELAKALGMSVRTLNRHFQKELAMTPAKYVRQHRLDAARQLLENSDMATSEIGRRLGYGDVGSFNRIFSRHFKATPASFRDQRRGS